MTLKVTRYRYEVVYRQLLIFISLFFFIPFVGHAQDGKDLFEKNCRVCHHIGEGKLVGPDLMDVTKKRDRQWLEKFITNSQEVIKSGDPVAVKLYEEHNKSLMPSFTQLSSAEINSIIDYLDKWEPAKVEVLTVDVNKKTGFTHEEYLRGERYFYGLIPLEAGGNFNCSSCHNTITSDSLNWNPSAVDLAQSFLDQKGMNIYQSMGMPVSTIMEEAHKGIKMSEQEIYYVSAYLSHIGGSELKEHKIFPVKLMLFLAFGALMTLALIDLFITKRIKYKAVHGVVILVGLAVHGWLAIEEAQALSRTQNYAPDQPIKFSHLIHAGENQTECRYCHFTADFSKSANIPSVNVCLNCHNVVRTGKNSGNFEINKIHRAAASGKPVAWVRVHNLPDHAFFNHAQHANVGNIECQTCHGKVEEMHILKQHSDLSMGWCVNCHRDTKVNFEGNKYYSTYRITPEIDENGNKKPVTVENIGGLDCMKCHY